MAKVLRSLAPKFNYVTVAIEESKNISKLSLDEFTGSLEAHEVRVNRATIRIGERALHVRSEIVLMKWGENGNSSTGTSCCGSRGRDRGFIWVRGRSGGRGRKGDTKSHIQCFN